MVSHSTEQMLAWTADEGQAAEWGISARCKAVMLAEILVVMGDWVRSKVGGLEE